MGELILKPSKLAKVEGRRRSVGLDGSSGVEEEVRTIPSFLGGVKVTRTRVVFKRGRAGKERRKQRKKERSARVRVSPNKLLHEIKSSQLTSRRPSSSKEGGFERDWVEDDQEGRGDDQHHALATRQFHKVEQDRAATHSLLVSCDCPLDSISFVGLDRVPYLMGGTSAWKRKKRKSEIIQKGRNDESNELSSTVHVRNGS